jgi:DNA-binding FadR family transcriptional regulator
MNNKETNEALKTIKNLTEKLNSLMDQQSKVINSLPETERAKVSFVVTDIEAIKKAIQNGDSQVIDKYLQKYAGTNTVR